MKIYLKEKNNLYNPNYKIYNCKLIWKIYYSLIYN